MQFRPILAGAQNSPCRGKRMPCETVGCVATAQLIFQKSLTTGFVTVAYESYRGKELKDTMLHGYNSDRMCTIPTVRCVQFRTKTKCINCIFCPCIKTNKNDWWVIFMGVFENCGPCHVNSNFKYQQQLSAWYMDWKGSSISVQVLQFYLYLCRHFVENFCTF